MRALPVQAAEGIALRRAESTGDETHWAATLSINSSVDLFASGIQSASGFLFSALPAWGAKNSKGGKRNGES
jgi:hypothetical protein